MINTITVTNYLGDSLTINTRFPEQSGFLVKDVTGLGPSKATINTTALSSGDGSFFNSARIGGRNIVLTLQLIESPSMEATRQRSYQYFPLKKPVTLEIETDTRKCAVQGYVESNEPDFFSENTATQISIVCADPYFYSTGLDGKIITVFSGIEPMFEFPIENASASTSLLEMGNILTYKEKNVFYNGDSEIGIVIFINALGPAEDITIYNAETRESMKINTTRLAAMTGQAFDAGDEIIISTIKGNKFVWLLREGLYTNILNCLDRNSDWFQLAKGNNIFLYTAVSGENNLHFSIENQTIYEGV